MKIKKNGFYDGDDKITDLAYHLNDSIIFEEDITLENLFDILIEFENLDLLFKSWTRGFGFKKYYDELKTDSEEIENDILYLEVSNVVDNFSYIDDDCNTINDLSIYPSISGISKEVNYSISIINLNVLKDLTIRYNKEIIIPRNFKEDPNYENPLFKGENEISLYDFIGCLLSEISFHGYRENKEEFLEEMDTTIEKSDIGEAIPFENIKIEFLEKDLKRLIEEEKYERAEMVKQEIKDLKNEKD